MWENYINLSSIIFEGLGAIRLNFILTFHFCFPKGNKNVCHFPLPVETTSLKQEENLELKEGLQAAALLPNCDWAGVPVSTFLFCGWTAFPPTCDNTASLN